MEDTGTSRSESFSQAPLTKLSDCQGSGGGGVGVSGEKKFTLGVFLVENM